MGMVENDDNTVGMVKHCILTPHLPEDEHTVSYGYLPAVQSYQVVGRPIQCRDITNMVLCIAEIGVGVWWENFVWRDEDGDKNIGMGFDGKIEGNEVGMGKNTWDGWGGGQFILLSLSV